MPTCCATSKNNPCAGRSTSSSSSCASPISRTRAFERGGVEPVLDAYRALLEEGWRRRAPAERVVRLLGVGVRFVPAASADTAAELMPDDDARQFVLSF